MQVATLNVSTSLRMKKRGNVPPRLDTLNRHIVNGGGLKEVGAEGKLTWLGGSYMCPL